MPSRNILKIDAGESFYHVYIRGGNRSRIFKDSSDYEKLLSFFSRYLSLEESKNSAGLSYPNYHNRVDLLAYCLMPNHIHMLIFQHQAGDMTEFMRSLLTSYSLYFNKKYKRSGPLFESRYKASLISDQSYLEHITRYIHLNPKDWRHYEYSSLPYYLQRVSDDWIDPKFITDMFKGPKDYQKFVQDYEKNKEMMDILKKELANSNDMKN